MMATYRVARSVNASDSNRTQITAVFWTYRKIAARDGIAGFVIFTVSVYVTP
jgi:hypothetical protein